MFSRLNSTAKLRDIAGKIVRLGNVPLYNWGKRTHAIESSNNSAIWFWNTGVMYFLNNAYYDGASWRYKKDGVAGLMSINTSGAVSFSTAVTGIAGEVVTWVVNGSLSNAGAFNATGTIAGSNLSGTNTGDQTSVSGSSGSCTGNAVTATTATNMNGGYCTTGVSTVPVGSAGGSNVMQIMGDLSNPAVMSFHRAGAYAINMGLDTDNVFRVGGWSDGLNIYRFTSDFSGNFVARGSVAGTNITAAGNVTGNAATATGLIGTEGDWANYRSRSVANMLGWKNYGNGHVIFDASNSTAPNGAAINNTNPTTPWTGAYPTLMGWNGTNTFGVRVDSARYADTISGSGRNWVAAGRSFGVLYTNTYGIQITVIVTGTGGNASSPSYMVAYVNGLAIMSQECNDGVSTWGGYPHSITFEVPAGQTFQVNVNTTTSVTYWSELR